MNKSYIIKEGMTDAAIVAEKYKQNNTLKALTEGCQY